MVRASNLCKPGKRGINPRLAFYFLQENQDESEKKIEENTFQRCGEKGIE